VSAFNADYGGSVFHTLNHKNLQKSALKLAAGSEKS
jgi:hypothetical protein